MSDPKDSTSFFRKVVKFVANPGTDWAELGVPTSAHSVVGLATNLTTLRKKLVVSLGSAMTRGCER